MPGAVLRTVQAAVVARPVTSGISHKSASLRVNDLVDILRRILEREQHENTPKHRPPKGKVVANRRPPTARSSSGLLSTDATNALKLPLLLQWGLQIENDPALRLRDEGTTLIAFWSSALFTLRYPVMSATIDLKPNTVVKAVKSPPLPMYSWRAKSPNARLVYTRDADEANAELEKLQPGPLGFDMEWKPNTVVGQIPNPVALVQLANDELVILVQVSAMRSAYCLYGPIRHCSRLPRKLTAFPAKLREVLGDPSYVKAGVSIKSERLFHFNEI